FLFLFVLCCRHPGSTLFPTRRSSDLGDRRGEARGRRGQEGRRSPGTGGQGALRPGRLPRPGPARAQDSVLRGARPPSAARQRGKDRKSTRLNSSHVKISYAVFCLKKK